MPETRDGRVSPRGAFFGRRKGHKLRPHRANLLATLLPKLALDLSQPAPTDPSSLFPLPVKAVALEVGFGSGENLVHQAMLNGATGFIGCEAFVNGMASALAHIEAAGLRNVRLHHGDALAVIDWLPAGGLAQVDILYPDPWPKRRHWKRRFISDAVVGKLARILAPGGRVRFATDIAGYAEWALLRFLRSREFEWEAQRADDWRKPWPGFAGTRYEAKANQQGRTPCYLVFRRV